MKLHLPCKLFRALVACFAPAMSLSVASASASVSTVQFSAPDVEQTQPMLCWAASAADVLASETGQDAAHIYRLLSKAAGHTPGYVESALSWYKNGAQGRLEPLAYDGRYTVSRHGFETLPALASSLEQALRETPAVSAMLRSPEGAGELGHAITVYAGAYEGGRFYLTFADSADGVQGLRRAEVQDTDEGLLLTGTCCYVSSLAWLGEDEADEAPATPVGAYMHSSPLLQEYTDMAENRGVYRFGASPSLIMYRNGEPDYQLTITPDFSSVADNGAFTLTHNNG